MILLIPGPTPVPGRVLRAQSRRMINHRCPAFHELLQRVTAGLKPCFRTAGDPLLLTASGTGGLEAALVNTLSPGDRVLAVSTGAFGKRFADIAAAYGAEVSRLDVEWGLPGALVLVDAISGLLATALEHDAWGLDVTVAGSQKAFMIPPGLSFVAMSDRAWEASKRARMPRFYFDLEPARTSLAKGENPWTPAVSLVYALDEALAMIAEEGHEAMLARHLRLRDGVRAGCRVLGLEPLAADSCASPAVTALRVPDGLDEPQVRARLRGRYGVEIAGGQGHLKGKIVRIGHLGWVSETNVLQGVALLGQALRDLGRPVDPAAAVAAAEAATRGNA
ncbi:MAG: alanine--glyoxylate aminotransferase family protein [Armatimonadetes bacterium]|nr:alanine--glyoxylate aminotransferase family protein [Armatimonadota bacterium]